MTRTTLLLGLAAVSLAGCLPTTPGELSNGGFTYFCASDDDLACQNDLFGASDVPPAIAVGAHFDLQFTPPIISDKDPSVTRLVPASPLMLGVEAGLGTDTTGFRFAKEGTVAVLAEHGNEVVDFVHLTGARVESIALVDGLGDQVGEVSISVTDASERISALPRDDAGHTLAGALKYAWQSSDESVLSLSTAFGGSPNQVTLVPHQAGAVTVSVSVQDQTVSLPVTVAGGAP